MYTAKDRQCNDSRRSGSAGADSGDGAIVGLNDHGGGLAPRKMPAVPAEEP